MEDLDTPLGYAAGSKIARRWHVVTIGPATSVQAPKRVLAELLGLIFQTATAEAARP